MIDHSLHYDHDYDYDYDYDYVPSKIEKQIIDNGKELGYDPEDKNSNPSGCNIWNDTNTAAIPPIKGNDDGNNDGNNNMFIDYSINLDRHTKAIKDFHPIPNLLKSIIDNNGSSSSSSSSSIEEICSAARYVPCVRAFDFKHCMLYWVGGKDIDREIEGLHVLRRAWCGVVWCVV
jgi:hypothetical protein